MQMLLVVEAEEVRMLLPDRRDEDPAESPALLGQMIRKELDRTRRFALLPRPIDDGLCLVYQLMESLELFCGHGDVLADYVRVARLRGH